MTKWKFAEGNPLRFMVLLLVCCYGQTSLYGQQNIAGHSKNIGEKCPDLTFSFINKPFRKNLYGYTNKVIVLDFFSKTCTSCIKGMPRMNALQEQFGDKIQIILVTEDSKAETKALFEKIAMLKKNTLPVLAGDKQLCAWFPHRWVPHEVWLDTQHVVRAISNPEDVNEENLSKIIAGKFLSLHLKKDQMDFNDHDYLEKYAQTGESLFKSTFTNTLGGLPGSQALYLDSNETRILTYNASLVEMYQQCCNGLNFNQMVLNVHDSSKWKRPGTVAQEFGRSFCYELKAPLACQSSV